MDLSSFLKQPPLRATRDRFAKVVMLGLVLPVGIILGLQYTDYAIFPGRTGVVWYVLDFAVFGFLVLSSLWEWMERRRSRSL
jgi:hypothetical protein